MYTPVYYCHDDDPRPTGIALPLAGSSTAGGRRGSGAPWGRRFGAIHGDRQSGEAIMDDQTRTRVAGAHSHVFLGAGHERNERRTWAVIALCTVMMLAEIIGGILFGSLALIADGLHMSTHAGAILVAALA
jgi:hypothetical protein